MNVVPIGKCTQTTNNTPAVASPTPGFLPSPNPCPTGGGVQMAYVTYLEDNQKYCQITTIAQLQAVSPATGSGTGQFVGYKLMNDLDMTALNGTAAIANTPTYTQTTASGSTPASSTVSFTIASGGSGYTPNNATAGANAIVTCTAGTDTQASRVVPVIVSSGSVVINTVSGSNGAYSTTFNNCTAASVLIPRNSTFTPIVNFAGIFDGNGFKIKNLSINRNIQYAGLFGQTASTGSMTIKNLGMVGGSISSSDAFFCYLGGIIGYAQGSSTTITNSYNTGTISSSSTSGGIIGYAPSTTTITNSYNTGSISTTSSSTITYSGGLIGSLSSATSIATITNSYNTGTISSVSTGFAYAGGVAGCTSSNARATITGSYNTGMINSSSTTTAISGGLSCGSGTEFIMTNSYNSGVVSSRSAVPAAAFSGGLVGWVFTTPTITNSYFSNTGQSRNGSVQTSLGVGNYTTSASGTPACTSQDNRGCGVSQSIINGANLGTLAGRAAIVNANTNTVYNYGISKPFHNTTAIATSNEVSGTPSTKDPALFITTTNPIPTPGTVGGSSNPSMTFSTTQYVRGVPTP